MKQQTQNQYRKMLASFRRSISFTIPRSLSFPNPRTTQSPLLHKPTKKSGGLHLRSASDPCRFPPVFSQLDDDIRSLLAWQSDTAGSPAWIADGLAQIDNLHAALDNLLRLPQAQDLLRHGGGRARWTERLLDDFLRLADAHGTFRSAIMSLRQHHSATQAAIRRGDEARLASCVRSQRRAEKVLLQLASAVRDVSRSPTAGVAAEAEAEVAVIMSYVTVLTATASAAVFSGIAAASAATPVTASRWSRHCMVGPLLCRRCGKEDKEGEWKEQQQRLEALEECMRALEEKNERVFRSLVNTRVTLLNSIAPL